MANEQNLKPFKKGKSGNPAGRPPKLPELDSLIAECLADEKNGMTAAAAILAKWRELATKGNLKAGEMLFDRGYGKPKQSHEHTGKDGEALPATNIQLVIQADNVAPITSEAQMEAIFRKYSSQED